MIWHHIAQRSGALVVSAALFDAYRFRRGDLNVIDVATIPNRFENSVAKTKNQNVLHRLFAKIMIDAINLAFTEDNANLLIEFFCRWQIAPKRFFDDHATPMISRFIG